MYEKDPLLTQPTPETFNNPIPAEELTPTSQVGIMDRFRRSRPAVAVATVLAVGAGAIGLSKAEATSPINSDGQLRELSASTEVIGGDANNCEYVDTNPYPLPVKYIVGTFGNPLTSFDIEMGIADTYYWRSNDRWGSNDIRLMSNIEDAKKVVTRPGPGIKATFSKKDSKVKSISMILNRDPKITKIDMYKGKGDVGIISPTVDIQPDMNAIGAKSYDLISRKNNSLKKHDFGCVTKIINKPQAGLRKDGGKAKIFFDQAGDVRTLQINGKKTSYGLY